MRTNLVNLSAATALVSLAVSANAAAKSNPATPPAADVPTEPTQPSATADAGTGKAKKVRVIGTILDIVADVPVPVIAKQGGSGTSNRSPYPFEKLEVGQSFGLKDKTKDSLSSIVSNQNRKDSNQRRKVGPDGNPIAIMQDLRDQNGVVIGTVPKPGEFEMEKIKEFVVADVDTKTDPQGASVRIWRIK